LADSSHLQISVTVIRASFCVRYFVLILNTLCVSGVTLRYNTRYTLEL